jgi:hypothetical protein
MRRATVATGIGQGLATLAPIVPVGAPAAERLAAAHGALLALLGSIGVVLLAILVMLVMFVEQHDGVAAAAPDPSNIPIVTPILAASTTAESVARADPAPPSCVTPTPVPASSARLAPEPGPGLQRRQTARSPRTSAPIMALPITPQPIDPYATLPEAAASGFASAPRDPSRERGPQPHLEPPARAP